MKMVLLYLRYKKESIMQVILLYIVFFMVIWLYNLPYYEAFIFAMELYGVIYIIYLIYEFYIFDKRYKILEENLIINDMQSLNLPQKKNVIEEMYADILLRLLEQKRKQHELETISSKNLKDYYACWAHQIKTPIAAAKLIIQSLGENEEAQLAPNKISALNQEIFKIDFYTDAVMDYLRLEDISSDYEFKECQIDSVVRKAVKKFAPQFIGRHISLYIEEIDDVVCSDSKWLGFIIEQLISNAIKYNNDGGSVRIYTKHNDEKVSECISEKDGTQSGVYPKNNIIQLIIEDTGIGISPEDIPRIMERGFTGYNGRLDKKSSGIGLYLCKRAADRLGFVISFDENYKNGARAVINMTQLYTQHE